MKICLYSVALELYPPRRVSSLNSTPLPKPGSWESATPNLCPQWSAFLFRTSWNSWEKRTFPGATGPNTEGPRGTRNRRCKWIKDGIFPLRFFLFRSVTPQTLTVCLAFSAPSSHHQLGCL